MIMYIIGFLAQVLFQPEFLFNGFYRKSKEGIVTLSFLDIKHCRFLSVIYLRMDA